MYLFSSHCPDLDRMLFYIHCLFGCILSAITYYFTCLYIACLHACIPFICYGVRIGLMQKIFDMFVRLVEDSFDLRGKLTSSMQLNI